MNEVLTFDLMALIMGLLFTASLVAIVSKKIKFPFTILLVIAGLALGWASQSTHLLHALSLFRLSPEVVFFVFLPVLIFESAFNLNARALLKNLFPILTLAIPGLLLSTATVGLLMHFVLSVPLGISFLFGALISATDPVAVIGLFKEMGAPKRLTLLVEGESLFNDGTALVLFRVILSVVLVGQFSGATITSGLLDFLIVFTGGVFTGIFLGVLFSKIIEIVDNDQLVEVTLTTILAHTAFMTAEHLLHVSGVMATVAAGLTMGSYGRTKISPPVHKKMGSFWEYFAFVCNSLIFLLVGLSIDLSMFVQNYGVILWAMLFVLIGRSVAVYTLFPLLEDFRTTEKVSRAFQTVIFWGGLRGALAMVMALSLPAELEHRSFILTITLGIVLFTLLVNGLSIKPLMSLVGLDRYSLKESYERSQALLLAKQRVLERIGAFSSRGAIHENVLNLRRKDYEGQISNLRGDLEAFTQDQERFKFEDESEVIFRHCLMIERLQYDTLFETGSLNEHNLKELHHLIDMSLDRLKEDHEIISSRDKRSTFTRLEDSLLAVLGILLVFKPAIRRFKTGRIAAGYEMERARFISSARVIREIEKMEKQAAASAEALRRARELFGNFHESAAIRMETIRAEFPEYVEKVEAGILIRFCLSTELDTFEELFSQGAISEKVLSEIREEITERLRKMRMRPVEELLIPPSKLIRMVPYFNELQDDEITRLVSHLAALSFLPGEEIVKEGDRGDSLFIIGRGQVDVLVGEDSRQVHLARLKAGDFFGEAALLHPQPRTATVKAATPCTLLELSRAKLMPYLEKAPHLKDTLEAAYRARILHGSSASEGEA